MTAEIFGAQGGSCRGIKKERKEKNKQKLTPPTGKSLRPRLVGSAEGICGESCCTLLLRLPKASEAAGLTTKAGTLLSQAPKGRSALIGQRTKGRAAWRRREAKAAHVGSSRSFSEHFARRGVHGVPEGGSRAERRRPAERWRTAKRRRTPKNWSTAKATWFSRSAEGTKSLRGDASTASGEGPTGFLLTGKRRGLAETEGLGAAVSK